MKKATKFVHRVRTGWNDRRVPNPVPRKGASEQWLFKQVWQVKRVVKVGKAQVPLAAQKPGVEVIDASSLFMPPQPAPERWEVPVPDDHTFGRPVSKEDHPDYRQDPIYSFGPRQRLLQGEEQACLLTKTQLLQGLPASTQALVGRVQLPDQDELVQRYILQAHKWDPNQVKLPQRFDRQLPGWKFKREWGIPAERFGSSMLYKLLGLCQRLGAEHPDLLHGRFVLRDPYVHAQYQLLDKQVQVAGVSQALVTASRPLPPLAPQQAVTDSALHQLPDLQPLSPVIDLKEEHIWRPQNHTGWLGPGLHRAPHTLLIRDPIHSAMQAPQKNATAIMFCFAHCLAYAKDKYGVEATELPEPVSVQCVSSDGVGFSFYAFQLNTLDYSSTAGTKNLAWVDADHTLFTKLPPRRGMLRMTRYLDYDPDVLDKFLAVYANGADLTARSLFNAASWDAEPRTLGANVLQ